MAHSHSHAHHDHDHHHHHHHAPSNFSRAFAIGLVLNVSFVAIEVFYGLMADSIALLADAGHNLSDVLGLMMAWGATILMRRKPSSRYTYGWRRTTVLAAFLNALLLMVVTGGIAWEGVRRLISPDEVQGQTIIVVAIVGILINGFTAFLFASGRRSDLNLRAAFWHMAGDALVSLGVVLAGIGILATSWLWLDPAFSLVISVVIVWNTWAVLRDSFNLAIDAVPTAIDERAVRLYLTELPSVAQIHDLHIWAMSTTENALTVHLIMPDGHPGDRFLQQICHDLHDRFDINHATLQIELGDTNSPCQLEPDHCV